MNERDSATIRNIMETLDHIIELPDEYFTGPERMLLLMVAKQVDIDSLGQMQVDEFKDKNFTYDEVKGICEEIKAEIADFIESFNELPVIEEKKEYLKELFGGLAQLPAYIMEHYPQYDAVLPIALTHPNARVPVYAHSTDAGGDIYAIEDEVVAPGETKLINLGFRVSIPPGWQLSMRPRGSMSLKTKMRIANSPSTVDPLFLQDVQLIVENIGTTPYTITQGDRIAQMVLERIYVPQYVVVRDITEHASGSRANEEGEQGFGSTGK